MTQRTVPNCIFCRIASGEIPTDIVAESASSIAFRDLEPQAPTHILVVPRRHIAALRDVGVADADLIGDLILLVRRVAEREGLFTGGYRVITNDGPDAGQSVHHLHFHVLGGEPLAVPLR
jgi:histidine triad (HIT) family protein